MPPVMENPFILERGPVGPAVLFSVLLHVPVLLFLGVGERGMERAADVTPVFEAAYAAGRTEYASGFDAASGSMIETPQPRSGPSGLAASDNGQPNMPRLLASDRIAPAFEKDTALPPAAMPIVAPRRLDIETRGRTWFAWYAGEVERRISQNFPRQALADGGITGQVCFRLSLTPDGGVNYVDVLKTDHPALAKAAEIAVKHAEPFPSYRALGLPFFPPLNITCEVAPSAVSQAMPSDDDRNLSASWTWMSQ